MADPNATNVGGVGGFVSQILDLINGMNGQGTNRGNTAAAMADPFASQRPGYQKDLLGLLTDPSSFKMDPGTIFARDQGLEGVARFGNAMFGTTRSGNTADTLNRDATGYASQAYNKRIDQLMTLSGATTGSPAAAAEQYIRGNQANDQNLASGLTGINSIMDMLSKSGIGSAALQAIGKALGFGGGSGFNLNSDGSINWGSTGTGSGDQGGFIGDMTDPSQGFGGIGDQGGFIGDPTDLGQGFDYGSVDGSIDLGFFDGIAGP